MNRINILMPSCEEPLSTSSFILGGRLLEYLIDVENNPEKPFISIENDKGDTYVYVRSEKAENGSEGVKLYIFSNDAFCNDIQNEFFVEKNTVEKLGFSVRDIYQTIERKLNFTI